MVSLVEKAYVETRVPELVAKNTKGIAEGMSPARLPGCKEMDTHDQSLIDYALASADW